METITKEEVYQREGANWSKCKPNLVNTQKQSQSDYMFSLPLI